MIYNISNKKILLILWFSGSFISNSQGFCALFIQSGSNNHHHNHNRHVSKYSNYHDWSSSCFSSLSPIIRTTTRTKPNHPTQLSCGDIHTIDHPNDNKYHPIHTNNTTNNHTKSSSSSVASQWHANRRKQILSKYSEQIVPLEQQTHGLFVGLPLLILSNVCLTVMALKSASLSIPMIMVLAIPGSVFSLWTLQILHDVLHSSLLPKPSFHNSSNNKLMKMIIQHRRKIQDFILFFGSMPSAFGFYLYLKYGHLTHHKNLGDKDQISLLKLFNSNQKNFEDGDVLFTAHRMKLLGDVGPQFQIPSLWSFNRKDHTTTTTTNTITMSISNAAFQLWKEGKWIRNATIFTISFLLERILLIWNDFIVALFGKNYFFPHKPLEFHQECTTYCRWAVTVRLALCWMAKSYKPLLFLYLSETLWSLPPHPICTMFITNHGSKITSNNSDGDDSEEACIPSSSTYAGKWYDILTLNTNLHVEHHDFPTIPLHKLGLLRKIAPEFYRGGERDDIYKIMRKTFAQPEFYACMNANVVI